MDEIFLNCKKKLDDLFLKYQSDQYMFQRLQYHIMNVLPSTLENESKTHTDRVTRNKFLINEQQIFIQVFLSKHQYYYLLNNCCFYHYDGKNYTTITEDDIQHELLTTISKDRTLMQWKYKTKINIIKQIKDRNLFTATPESETIQNVLQVLYPTFFSNKQEAKYFLTVIGDNILKKNQDLIFLIKPKTKKLIGELENIAYYNVGVTNVAHNLITKYHENYEYDKCRLLKIVDTVSNDIWNDVLKKMGINLFCVAAHYSNRYGNSDAFILNHVDEHLRDYTFYLKKSTKNDILTHFSAFSIEKSNATMPANFTLNWKNMHYLWKLFISHHGYPNMIYSNTLKTLLRERFTYDEEQDAFLNITSKYLPLTSDFILFWENNVNILEDANSGEEYEIDEICYLFKKWSQIEDNLCKCATNGNIGENDVLKIVAHYFPNVEIVENKFFLNIKCLLWNKRIDIQIALNEFKTTEQSMDSLISIDDAYQFYCSFCNKGKTKIVSKRYFEKYVSTYLATHILYEKFISIEWFETH